MTLENDFLLFAQTAVNIESQAAYAADSNTLNGRPSGVFPSNVFNKIGRQATYGSAALAQLIVSYATQSALDDGNLSTFTANLVAAIQAIATGAAPVAPPIAPGGRLTLTTGVPLISSDVIGSTVVYYTPTINGSLPIYNGSAWTNPQLTGDLSLSLTAAAAANGIVDVFGTYNGGNPVLGFGPVWATNTPGSCSRGVGAGTTQISRVHNGLWVNSNIISLINGASTYANIPIGQATFLGSLAVDAIAGQTTCHVSYGQSRKWGVWNAYNRLNIALQAGDSAASWTENAGAWRSSNNTAANSLKTFTGLAEEVLALNFIQSINAANGGGTPVVNLGIGFNSASSPSGKVGATTIVCGTGMVIGLDLIAELNAAPSLGLNTISALEFASGPTGQTFFGTASSMLLSAAYRA